MSELRKYGKYIKRNIIQPLKRRKSCYVLHNRVNLEDIGLSEIGQPQKEKYYMILLI